MDEFIAHFRVDSSGREAIQTVCTHSRRTADYAFDALRPIGLPNAGYLAGLFHDEGKLKPEFQAYIRDKNGVRGSVDHSSCGMQDFLQRFHGREASTREDVACEIMAYAVAAHHGLMDIVSANHENSFLRRLNAETKTDCLAKKDFNLHCASESELLSLFHVAADELVRVLDHICEITNRTDEAYFHTGMLTRLVLSAVIEGDRRDTAEFMNAPESDSRKQVNPALWGQCLARVEAGLAALPAQNPIDLARKAISDKCREQAKLPCGVYRLNVPTGGGKTLSCLRFALAHASVYNKKRIIFTSPLLSILDQNAQVLRKFIQDDSLILEHHSNIVQESADDDEKSFERELRAESWSAPIIITTLVQLLNTFFSGKSSCIRRFHALCDSVIVIDEVQTVPNKLLSLFHLAVDFLSNICQATVILCSATQPCSEYTEHPISSEIRDLVPEDKSLRQFFQRTEIHDGGRKFLADVPSFAAQILTERQSLLIVCNTKSQASTLYLQLKKHRDCMVFHLSAGMCMAHRRAVLARLEDALARHRNEPKITPKIICISTQVIEAGVDISFDSVIRFAAGMDSIIQSAGRCNRNGEHERDAPVYIVHCEDERLSGLREIQNSKNATLALLSRFSATPDEFQHSLFSDSAIRFFYRSLYSNMPAHACDMPVKGRAYTLYQLLSDNVCFVSGVIPNKDSMQFYLPQAFQTAGREFAVFDEDTTDVIVPYGPGEEIANELNSGWTSYDLPATKKLLNQAKPYIVSLYRGQLIRLEQMGAIHAVADGAILVLDPRYYDKEGVGVLSEPQEVEFLHI